MIYASPQHLPRVVRDLLPPAALTAFHKASASHSSERDALAAGWAEVRKRWEPGPRRRGRQTEWRPRRRDKQHTTKHGAPLPAPRPLYISRRVLNAQDIIDWAMSSGFKTTVPAEEMHVTQAYSTEPVQWRDMGQSPRQVDEPADEERDVRELGDEGAVVLAFNSEQLADRFRELLDRGASWDHDSYVPHITLTYLKPDSVNLETLTPYTGPIVLGPERFQAIEVEKAGFDPNQDRDDRGRWSSDLMVHVQMSREIRANAPATAVELQLRSSDNTPHYRMEIVGYKDNVWGVGYVENLTRAYSRQAERLYQAAADYVAQRGGRLYAGMQTNQHSDSLLSAMERRGSVLRTTVAGLDRFEVLPSTRKAFNPSQPRHPAGSPDGGQWVGDASRELLDDRTAKLVYDDWDQRLGNVGEETNATLAAYTDNTYGPMNEFLRGRRTFQHADEKDAFKSMIDRIDKAFGVRGAEAPQDLVVYRMYNRLQNQSGFTISRLVPGQEWADSGFISTSVMSRFAPKGEAGQVFMPVQIRVPKGTAALPMRRFSDVPSEYEVLLPRGTRFRVDEVTDRLITLRVVDAPVRKDYDPSQPRHPRGHPDGGQWTSESLIAEGRRRLNEAKSKNTLGGSDAEYTLSSEFRRTEDAVDEMLHTTNASNFASMDRAMSSKVQWGMGWAGAHDEWLAAEALGGNGAMSKLTATTIAEKLAGSGYSRALLPLSAQDVAAFSARQRWHQAQFQTEFGGEVTLYRGVTGAYAKKLFAAAPTSGPAEGVMQVDMPTYALSSWTPSRGVANEFAKGKTGIVVSTVVRAQDVWMMPRRGTESVLRVADARDEVVVLNKTPTRRVKVEFS